MTRCTVTIQVNPESVPSIPSWLAEGAAFAQVLISTGILKAIEERVQFVRARFGQYDTIDFVVVLIGYGLSGERTLQAFYERLLPFADAFMALFGRHHLPSRSALSRFLAALDQATVELLRTLFQEDLVKRRPPSTSPGGLSDRLGNHWLVVDVDATRQAARQRALPQLKSLPAPQRRLNRVCRPAYLGRKRGEVGRSRTTVLQATTHQWIGTYAGAGNGDYRGELKRALEATTRYATALSLPVSQVLIRLDGLYGNAAPVTDVLQAGFGLLARSRDYALLDQPEIKARLACPPDAERTHPESGMYRALYDCPDIALTPTGPRVRLIVATHPASSTSASIGKQRDGLVYELFVTHLPSPAFSPQDVLDLYLHRGSFETVLADEDVEQDPDRWCSCTPCGQEFWQIISQWLWNLRQHPQPRLHPKLGLLDSCCMALRNGRANRLPAAFQDRHLRLNLMGLSSVLPIILCIHKNAGRSAMALTVCCMQLASGIVGPAPCGLRVKKALTPRNHVGSVPFSGQPPPLKRFPQHPFPRGLKLPQRRLNQSHASQCFGKIGHVVNSDGIGSI